MFRFLAPLTRAPEDGAGGTPAGAAPVSDPATTPPAGDAAQADGGLFDAVEAADPGADPDGKPQRPAWLAEKYWDAEAGTPKVEDLARSHAELRTMIAKGQQKPPATADAYEVPAVEGVADPLAVLGGKDDPLWAQVRTAAHSAGVSQTQMAAILGPVLAAAAAKGQAADPTPDPEATALAAQEARRAELARLGPNGNALVKQTGAWLAGLAAKGIFTQAEITAARSIATADGVRFLAKLRGLTGEQGIPMDAFASEGSMTQRDAEDMMTEGFRKNDMKMVAKGRDALEKMQRAGTLA